MRQEERNEVILGPVRPTGGLFGRTLTVGPYQVGLVIVDGELQPPFTEGAKQLPGGRVETYVASTAPVNLVFWLDDPGDPAGPAEGLLLEQPVLTADRQPVTGRIELTLSVITEEAFRLLRLRGMDSNEIRVSDISNAIKGELLAKVLALELYRYTSDELRGNRRPLQDIYGSIRTELASTFSGYGLRLDNFTVSWGLTFREREDIKEARHRSAVRDVEREGELEQARRRGEPGRRPESVEQATSPSSEIAGEPSSDWTGDGSQDTERTTGPDGQGEDGQGSGAFWWQLTVGVLLIAGFAGVLLFFTLDSTPDSPEDSSASTQVDEPETTSVSALIDAPTRVPTPIPTAADTLRSTPISISTPRSSERARGDLSCFSPCTQRSDPIRETFDNFLVEATFFNPTRTESFAYGFTIEGAYQGDISEHIEIRIKNDRTWRAFIRKVYHESSPPNRDLRQVELGGGEIPEPFVYTNAGASNKLEASVIGDEGCLYVNAILISCFDISGRTLTREILISSDEGDVLYTGFRAREAQAGT